MTQPMNVPYLLKLRIADFELLEREGAFSDFKKVELIEGAIIAMNAEYRRHTLIKNELMFRLRLALRDAGSRFIAVVEPTLALPPHNLPEPDVMVIDAPSAQDYFRIEHVAIVIEVADSTIVGDMGDKARMYAANNVPEYWVVDVVGAAVHQFWNPGESGFAERRAVRLGDRLVSVTMPELMIDGDGI